jgi:uncharacterized protein YbaP (TraB family)
LWKVADADTTIYLFGTVHALPKDVDWYRGPIAAALTAAQVLVTEIPPGELTTPAVQQAFLTKAQLPAGQSLRGLLTAEQRATYEAALAKFGLPVAAFDKVEPWFAAMTLSALPLLKGGYSMEAGVESAIGRRAGTKARAALETVDGQLRLFDEMPMAVQTAYLVRVAGQLGGVVRSMNDMVAAWAKGDAEGLAKLMNEELDDPALADRLLYARNRNWAQWVAKRLDEPGTVFVAVGAGHLAGTRSVQDYLGQSGTAVVRVQ